VFCHNSGTYTIKDQYKLKTSMVRYAEVWQASVWHGLVYSGLGRLGSVCYGLTWVGVLWLGKGRWEYYSLQAVFEAARR